MSIVWDVAIAGGGATGLTLALALRVLSGGALRVALIEPNDPAVRSGPRTSALAEGPRRMLERLGVWTGLAAGVQPVLRMEISDARLADAVKSTLLRFEGARDDEPLAYMLFHRDLEPHLLSAATSHGVEVIRDAIDAVDTSGSASLVTTAAGRSIRARLLVGADGLRSRTRTAAKIGLVSWPYHRAAIVLTIAHELEHGGLAIQHFLEAGPFASLPLTGRRSSIVWTEPTLRAEEYVAAPSSKLVDELEERLGGRFGEIAIEERPQSFRLVFQIARRFAARRLALVGDAAHRVHPLAGQGLNLGMRDVATLAELVIEQSKLGLDPGSGVVVQEYERRRRFDATASAAAFDFMHRSYSAPNPAARIMRRVGMSAVERMPAIKSLLNREASGLSGDAPALFR